MVGVKHQDQVGPRRRQLILLRGEQFCSLAIRPVALDEMREDRGVRHAEPGDDLRHLLSPFAYATGWPISSTCTARMRSL